MSEKTSWVARNLTWVRICLLILIFGVLCALNLRYLSYGFWADDPGFYQHLILQPDEWWRMLTPLWGWYYRATQLVFLKVAFSIFGYDPMPLHALSIALHALNAGLVGWLAFRLFGRERYGWLAAWIFVLYPNMSSAVYWVAAVSTLLVTLFYLLGLHAWISFRDKPSWQRFGLVLICALLAFASREESLTFIFAILAVDLLKNYSPLKAWKGYLGVATLSSVMACAILFSRWNVVAVTKATGAVKIIGDPTAKDAGHLFPQEVPTFIHFMFGDWFFTGFFALDIALLCVPIILLRRNRTALTLLLWGYVTALPQPLIIGKFGQAAHHHYMTSSVFTLLWAFCAVQAIAFVSSNLKATRRTKEPALRESYKVS